MCGLAGFSGTGDRRDLDAMVASLAHRGPDAQGHYASEDDSVFIGHRRLIILDAAGGQQPMWNSDGSIGVVYNGEIYNHAALRTELQTYGHHFRSHHCDTEVLVHGYAQWGANLPEKLNGMFAFAIYDKRRRRIVLARDRFGEKPLYYAQQGDLFAFASELTAITKHRDFSASLNQRALQKYFAYGYLPAPNAIFDDACKLPGGHTLIFDLGTRGARVETYWRFSIEADEGIPDSAEPQLVDELRHLFGQAVQRRLMSDVPLGVFLSGGLDSSAVLSAAAKMLPASRVDTFTIGFTEPTFDESAHARVVAEYIGSRHHEKILALDDAGSMVTSVLSRLDEPLADASLLPTYLLSAFARETVTVALSGDGGDELFAGYDPFRALGPAAHYARLIPSGLHKNIRRLVDLLPRSERNMSLDFKLRRALSGMAHPPAMWNPVWMAPIGPNEMADIFHEPLHIEEVYDEAIAAWNHSDAASAVDRTLEFFTNFYLPDDILMKVDRASMMASLETRAVFLDNDLVDFCRRLPHRFKLRNGQSKYLLKRAFDGEVPTDIVHRKKKGFGIPTAKWLKAIPPLPPLSPIPGVDMSMVGGLWSEHRDGRADHRLALWAWLALQNFDQGAVGHHPLMDVSLQSGVS